jgi:hypothetical protein
MSTYSTSEEYYKVFFSRLLEQFDKEFPTLSLRTRRTSGKPFCSFPTGSSDYRYYIAFRGGNRLSCELYIDLKNGEHNLAELYRLMQYREVLEKKTGILSWEPLETKRACRIAAYITRRDVDEMIRWAVDKLREFHKTFGPLIQ